MKTALAALGFTMTVGQIVLMRELVATFYGNELLFGLILAVWLAWVAVGAWGLARWLERRLARPGPIGGLLILAGLLLPAQMALVRDARRLLRVTPGAFVEFGPLVVTVILLLAPLCLVGGLLFTLGARRLAARGGTVGQAYVWESVGAVAGGALFSFLLIRWLDPFQTAFLVLSVDLMMAGRLWLLTRPRRAAAADHVTAGSRWRRWLWLWLADQRVPGNPVTWLFLLLLPLLVGAFYLGAIVHQTTLRWQWSDLVFAADSPYGRLIIQARASQRIFFENGLLAFETQGTFPEEVAHFPLLAHPNPRQVLLIGGGVAGDVREILKHPVESVTYVELDPLLIEAALAHLPANDVAALEDPRTRLVLTDGRLYVKTAHRTYDIVILDLPEPATGALNRFYTREFFTEVQAILSPGGIFALGLPSAENYWSPELARRNGSVYHTLRAVFPHVVVLPGEHNFFLASEQPLPTDPSLLAQRLTQRNITTRWVTPSYIEYVFTTDRFAGVQRELEAVQGVPLNRDLKPICYYYSLALWLSRFYPNLRGAFEATSLANFWWVAVALAALLLWVRWRRGWAVPVAVAGIGLAQMMLEVVILFGFQVLHGYVFAEVSLIVTAFMAGLAVGSAASNGLLQRWQQPARGKARHALLGVLVAVIGYSAVFPLLLAFSLPAPQVVFPLLAWLAGCLTGMAFPLAVQLVRGTAGRVAGLLYAADLAGGCLGALLGAVLLVPVLGIPQTCAAIALVGLVSLAGLL